MKKSFFSLLLLLIITTGANAQTDPVPMANTPSTQLENNTMFFNPVQNPYYTEMYRSYWVWDVATLSWVKRVEVVAPITPGTNKNTDTRYQNIDVWKGNADLRVTYPVKPNGK